MKQRKRVSTEPMDCGPIERQQHNRVTVERDINNRPRLRVTDQLEIDRLLLERLIDLDQHTAGEHLLRDITAAGYFPACKWAMDSNIRGDTQSVSQHRADALVKIGLGRAWLDAKAGKSTTKFLFGVILGERKVQDPQIPYVQNGLSTYQGFEGWWHGRDHDLPVPDLLAEMPRVVGRQLPRPFHYQMR